MRDLAGRFRRTRCGSRGALLDARRALLWRGKHGYRANKLAQVIGHFGQLWMLLLLEGANHTAGTSERVCDSDVSPKETTGFACVGFSCGACAARASPLFHLIECICLRPKQSRRHAEGEASLFLRRHDPECSGVGVGDLRSDVESQAKALMVRPRRRT